MHSVSAVEGAHVLRIRAAGCIPKNTPGQLIDAGSERQMCRSHFQTGESFSYRAPVVSGCYLLWTFLRLYSFSQLLDKTSCSAAAPWPKGQIATPIH